jgi:hypothetical protein
MPGRFEEIRSVFENLERDMFDVVNGVQEGKEIRTAAFERTEQLSRQLTALLKGHELIPRYIPQGLSQAAAILQNEAAYMRSTAGQEQALAMSNAIQLTSSLIIGGECHDDRRPGISRII